jgi:hypothetical protein
MKMRLLTVALHTNANFTAMILFPGRRWARSGRGLPKGSHGPAMPYTSKPTEKAASGVVRSQGWRPAAVIYPLGHPTPYVSAYFQGDAKAASRLQRIKDKQRKKLMNNSKTVHF